MLETDEVDVDLFTPAAGTSLAAIFSATQVEQDKDNTSLKYVPQIPIQPIQETTAETQTHTLPTNCIFASAVSGYEWTHGTYNLRENLGFAVIKSAKENIHHLIIYTSEKNTLSLATVTSTFIVNVKKDVSISYYDNFKKYWLICASNTKIANIVECLKNLNVNINHSSDDNVEEILEDTLVFTGNLESDGESSNNKRSKDSILKRMATMGQSVLPSKSNITAQSTDSTDEKDKENYHKLSRHKLIKTVPKRPIVENYMPNTSNHIVSNKPLPASRPLLENSTIILPLQQEVALIKNIDLNGTQTQHIDLNSYDMNCFISEQRISNAELRINVNRLSDKLEQFILDKAKATEFEKIQSSSNEPLGIVDKLIKEYESKIQSYEKFIESQGFDCRLLIPTHGKKCVDSNLEYDESMKIMLLCEEKDKEIELLQKKITMLTETHASSIDKHIKQKNTLSKEIIELKKDINDKNEHIMKMESKIQVLMASTGKSGMAAKIKKLMDDTYQTISMNFDDEDNYLGATVKTVVGSVIKNSTLESLKYDIENKK